MKKLFLAVLSLAMAMPLAQAQTTVNFRKGPDFDKILEEARQKDRMIFADLMATWCGPCKKADREVFHNDSLAPYFNEHFICVQYDADTPEGKAFQSRYNLTALPSFVFIRPSGEVAVREGGYSNPERLMGQAVLAYQLRNAASEQESMDKAYQSRKHDSDTTFLKQYMRLSEKNGIEFHDVLERYLALVKSEGMTDRDLFGKMFEFRKGLRMGGVAEEIFNRSENGWIAAEPAFRGKIDYLYVVSDMAKHTYEYATKTANYGLMIRSLDFMARYSGREVNKTQMTLDFYNTTGNGKQYKKLAKSYLDSLYRASDIGKIVKQDQTTLDSLSRRMDERKKLGNIDEEGIKLSFKATRNRSLGNRLGYQLSTYAHIYLRFAQGDRKAATAMLPYLKTATQVASFNPVYLSNYADGLYLAGQRDQAIEAKKKAIGMDEYAAEGSLAVRNLKNMEQNKPLEWM